MLDLQHVPNIKDSKRLIKGFIPTKGVAIAIPTHEHKKIRHLDCSTIMNARVLLARELKNLRQCIDIPYSAITMIIEANKKKYPHSFNK